jgi:hypothetical protein
MLEASLLQTQLLLLMNRKQAIENMHQARQHFRNPACSTALLPLPRRTRICMHACESTGQNVGFHRSQRCGPEQWRTPHLSQNGSASFLSRRRLQKPCCCKGLKLTRCCEEEKCCGSRQHGISTAAEWEQQIRQEAEDDTGGQDSQLSMRSSASSHRRRE